MVALLAKNYCIVRQVQHGKNKKESAIWLCPNYGFACTFIKDTNVFCRLNLLVRWIELRKPFHLIFIRHIEVTLLLVQLVHTLHIVIGKGEVEGLDVLVDIVWIRGTGNDREAHLHVPAVDGLQCLAFAILIRPELARNPNLRTVNAAVLYGASHAALIAIGVCRVNVAVAAL